MFLLDTNILIHYVRRDLLSHSIEAEHGLLSAPGIPILSIVTVGEIRAFAAESSWGAAKQRYLDDLLAYFTVVPLPFAGVIDAYVQVSERSRQAGRTLGKNDLWIAATAITTGATLLTTDKDFDHLHPTLLNRVWVNPVNQ